MKNYAYGVTSPSPAPDPSSPGTAASGELTAELAVTGMHCGSCSALIEESLSETTGVIRAEVDLDSGRAVVAFDPSQVDPDRLLAVVAEAGYRATPVG